MGYNPPRGGWPNWHRAGRSWPTFCTDGVIFPVAATKSRAVPKNLG